MKNILAISGSSQQGKSETIKNFIPLFQSQFPSATVTYKRQGYDVKVIIVLPDGRKVGIESLGDPGSQLPDSLEDFAKNENCDLIICGCRSRGATLGAVYQTASTYNYEVVRATNYRSDTKNHTALNKMSADHIFQLILTLL